jgi:hypothetical protein
MFKATWNGLTNSSRNVLNQSDKEYAGSAGRPDCIIIGGARCGTTWVYNYLRRHPHAFVPFIKETNFFVQEFERGEKYYFSHYFSEKTEQALGFDISPRYMYEPSTPERIATVIPEASLVVILRDPVERAWSQYVGRRKLKNENRPFMQIIREEARRLNSGERWGDDFGSNYLYRGLYAEHLIRYLRYFSSNQIQLLFFEDLQENPEMFVQNLCAGVGLPTVAPPTSAAGESNSSHSIARIPALQQLLWKKEGPAKVYRTMAKLVVPRPMRPQIVRLIETLNLRPGKRQSVPELERQVLSDFFQSHNRHLGELFGVQHQVERWS